MSSSHRGRRSKKLPSRANDNINTSNASDSDSKNSSDTTAHDDDNKLLNSFLIELAQNANPKRFFPFPSCFRVEHKLLDSDPKLEVDPFAPYSVNEFYNVEEALPNLHKLSFSEMTPNQHALYHYITDVKLNIAFHGKSIHNQIDEFEFRYSPEQERIRKALFPQVWYLYHGSPAGNWHSIVRNGIKSMSNTDLQTNGAVYGAGVYASTDIRIGISYGTSHKSAYVAVIEVYEDPEQYRAKNCNQYIVLPPTTHITPRYLLRINGYMNTDGRELLTFYEKQRAPRDTSHYDRRLIIEKKELSPYISTTQHTNDKTWSLSINNIPVNINIAGFPFDAPLVYLPYKLTTPLAQFNKHGVYLPSFNHWNPIKPLIDIVNDLVSLLKNNSATDDTYTLTP